MRLVDPFAEMDRLSNAFFAGNPAVRGMMPMDLFEVDGKYIARFDLPGIDPESIELTVENNVLTVTVERTHEDTEGVNWLVRERPSGRHSRQLRLGPTLDASRIEADYNNGVLTVTIPMREEAN